MTVPSEPETDLVMGGFKFRKGDTLTVNVDALHKDPSVWQEPDKFIPERFDSHSEFFLKPDGQKRSPYSFIPFFGGRRICLGRSFAENASKITVSAFLWALDLTFEE